MGLSGVYCIRACSSNIDERTIDLAPSHHTPHRGEQGPPTGGSIESHTHVILSVFQGRSYKASTI